MRTTRARRRTALLGGLVAGAVLLAACGNDSDDEAQTEPADEETEATAEPAPDEGDEPEDDAGDDEHAGDAIVHTGDTDLGPVLTTEDGFTLYGFEPDEGGIPTCEDDCADAWPPLIVDGSTLPEGLDSSVFSVVQRSDGSYQLAAGDWPLYRYFDDNAPGDTNGQAIPQWWVVTPEGELNMTES